MPCIFTHPVLGTEYYANMLVNSYLGDARVPNEELLDIDKDA